MSTWMWLLLCTVFATVVTSFRTRLAREDGTIGGVAMHILTADEAFRHHHRPLSPGEFVVQFRGDCSRPLRDLAWDMVDHFHGDITSWDFLATCLKNGKLGRSTMSMGLVESSWSVLNSISPEEPPSPAFCPLGQKTFSVHLTIQSEAFNVTIRPSHGPCVSRPLELVLHGVGISYLRLEDDIATQCALGTDDAADVRDKFLPFSEIHFRHMREKRLPVRATSVSTETPTPTGGVAHVLRLSNGRNQATTTRYMSQAGQDEWVMEAVYPDVPYGEGFFVELGAVDGVRLSNTHALEWSRGWSGICIEPSMSVQYLPTTRPRCKAVDAVVSSRDGDVCEFFHAEMHDYLGIVAGIRGLAFEGRSSGEEASSAEQRAIQEASTRRTTRSLASILDEADAPAFIHYLSLDVEGAEWDILRPFPFDRYTFGALTIEHNRNTTAQTLIRGLLRNHDYVWMGSYRVDDYFVHATVLDRMKRREALLHGRRGGKPRRIGTAGTLHPIALSPFPT